MKSYLWIACFLTISLGRAIAQPTSRPVSDYSNAELIDRIVDLSNEEFGVQTNILPYGSAATGLPQGLIRQGDAAPKPAVAMKELVRRGAAAMPELLTHLDDGRKTKATVKRMMSGIVYGAEYDWNQKTDKRPPMGVGGDAFESRLQTKPREPASPDEYTLAVGDFCYETIGRIVNREYRAVRYQPTAMIIVNSPVLSPDLCAVVRGQWSEFTATKHRDSLIGDVVRPDVEGRDIAGVQILMRYYPASVIKTALARLQIPTYDSEPIRRIVEETLIFEGDREKRKKLIDDFVAQNGAASRDGFIAQLWDVRYYNVGYPAGTTASGPGPTVKASPKEMLSDLVPNFDPKQQPMVESMDRLATWRFCEALDDISSPDIDQAIWEMFRTRIDYRATDVTSVDYFAKIVINRLAHQNHDQELLGYCRRRRGEVPQDSKQFFDELIGVLEQKPPK